MKFRHPKHELPSEGEEELSSEEPQCLKTDFEHDDGPCTSPLIRSFIALRDIRDERRGKREHPSIFISSPGDFLLPAFWKFIASTVCSSSSVLKVVSVAAFIHILASIFLPLEWKIDSTTLSYFLFWVFYVTLVRAEMKYLVLDNKIPFAHELDDLNKGVRELTKSAIEFNKELKDLSLK